MPYFLRGIEVLSEPSPIDSPDIIEESLVEIRKDWEKTVLRRIYAKIIGTLFNATSSLEARVRLKQNFSRQLSTFEEGGEGTRYWLKQQFDLSEFDFAQQSLSDSD